VDYATRREHLARLAPSAPLDGWRDGAIKLHVIAKTLGLRRQRPQLFARGEYTPLHIQGALAAHVIAFERTHGKSRAVAIATRLPLGMQAELAVPLVPPELWRGAHLHLPGTAWRNVLTGETLKGEDGRLLLRDALATMPIALLEPMPDTA
jgi:(1->4)-alpha-D-glucan 1-alpha-D-glucosylmutase